MPRAVVYTMRGDYNIPMENITDSITHMLDSAYNKIGFFVELRYKSGKPLLLFIYSKETNTRFRAINFSDNCYCKFINGNVINNYPRSWYGALPVSELYIKRFIGNVYYTSDLTEKNNLIKELAFLCSCFTWDKPSKK